MCQELIQSFYCPFNNLRYNLVYKCIQQIRSTNISINSLVVPKLSPVIPPIFFLQNILNKTVKIIEAKITKHPLIIPVKSSAEVYPIISEITS